MDIGPWETDHPKGGDLHHHREQQRALQALADEAAEAVKRVYHPPTRPKYSGRAVVELDEAWAALTGNMDVDLDAHILSGSPKQPRSGKKLSQLQQQHRVPAVTTNPIVSKFRGDPAKPAAPSAGARASPRTVTMLHDFDRHSELSFGGATPRKVDLPVAEVQQRPRRAQAALDAMVAQALRRPGCPPSYQRAVERAERARHSPRHAGGAPAAEEAPTVVRAQTARPDRKSVV